MKKSGLADSPLFSTPQQPAQPQTPVVQAQGDVAAAPHPAKSPPAKKKKPQTTVSIKRDTMPPRHHDANHDTTVARYHDTIVEVIRRALKEFGKEAATHRFTAEEKKKLAQLIFSYRQAGIKTSENEIARIAINFIVSDYEANGQNSLLDKVLNALNE